MPVSVLLFGALDFLGFLHGVQGTIQYHSDFFSTHN
jgi:hypothetical protein